MQLNAYKVFKNGLRSCVGITSEQYISHLEGLCPGSLDTALTCFSRGTLLLWLVSFDGYLQACWWTWMYLTWVIDSKCFRTLLRFCRHAKVQMFTFFGLFLCMFLLRHFLSIKTTRVQTLSFLFPTERKIQPPFLLKETFGEMIEEIQFQISCSTSSVMPLK